MAETGEPSQAIFARSGSVVSRFNEQFSDSSGVCSPVRSPPCPSRHPHHIIQRLRVESARHGQLLNKTDQASTKNKAGTFAERRSRRMSTPTAIAYERRRISAKQLVEKHRSAREARRKYEKELKRKGRLCGTMWGYDPMAGRIPDAQNTANSDHHVHGYYIFRGSRNESDEYGVDEIDMLGRRTGRQWLQGTKWGIECGGPGREPRLEGNCGSMGSEECEADALRRRRTQRRSQSHGRRLDVQMTNLSHSN